MYAGVYIGTVVRRSVSVLYYTRITIASQWLPVLNYARNNSVQASKIPLGIMPTLCPSLFMVISQRHFFHPLCSTPNIWILIHLLRVTEQESFPLKNTLADVDLIMCGRKSQETNGKKGINSSQLAAAQHLMLTLKLCQKKCLSIKETVFYTVSVFLDHSDLP